MKVIFKKDDICTAVMPLASGIASKVTVTATDCILICATKPSTCVLTTHDLEKGVRVIMTDTVDVIEEGSAVINATKFTQTVRAMEGGEITLSVDDRMNVIISCGRSSHTMVSLSAAVFPEIPRLTSPNGFTVSQKLLKSMMGKCLFAMGVNDQRPVLNGLYMNISDNHLDMVSCDSFKMAVCGTKATLENLNSDGNALNFKVIIPNRSVNELYKLLDDKDDEKQVKIFMSKKYMIIVMEDITFFCKLIEGEYVDYHRIIIRNHKISVLVDRECLLGALERAALITEEKVAGAVRSHVRLVIEGNMLKITAASGAGSSYDELAVAHDGEDMAIAFNNRYLIESLRACRADMVRISLTSAMTSINIQPDHPETDENGEETSSDLFFLLPVRMKE